MRKHRAKNDHTKQNQNVAGNFTACMLEMASFGLKCVENTYPLNIAHLAFLL